MIPRLPRWCVDTASFQDGIKLARSAISFEEPGISCWEEDEREEGDEGEEEGGGEATLTIRATTNVLSPSIWSASRFVAELVIPSAHLGEIPIGIRFLTQLRVLSVPNNCLSSLPDVIGDIISITSLDISSNHFRQIPHCITKLVRLESFFVNKNRITELPEEIGDLSNLLYFSANDNQLTRLPHRIRDLTALKQLHLNKNDLVNFPEDILVSMTSLHSLGLVSNALQTIPRSVCSLGRKMYLDARSNHITSVPDFIRSVEIQRDEDAPPGAIWFYNPAISFLDLRGNPCDRF